MFEYDVSISRHARGYYVLKINGVFEGNFDTAEEAMHEAEEIKYERMNKGVV